MTHAISNKSLTLSFFTPIAPDDDRIFGRPSLHIPVTFDLNELENLDQIIFHVTDDVVLEADPHKYAAGGLGVSEIIGPKGYSYANSAFFDYLPIVNPFYEVKRTTQHGVFEGNENDVSIRLEFSEHADGKRAVLTHQWPDKKPRVREFIQVLPAYGI